MDFKRGPGRKRKGMIEKNERYRDVKRRAENQSEYKVWLPGTCVWQNTEQDEESKKYQLLHKFVKCD